MCFVLLMYKISYFSLFGSCTWNTTLLGMNGSFVLDSYFYAGFLLVVDVERLAFLFFIFIGDFAFDFPTISFFPFMMVYHLGYMVK